jgi:hypothetical protein
MPRYQNHSTDYSVGIYMDTQDSFIYDKNLFIEKLEILLKLHEPIIYREISECNICQLNRHSAGYDFTIDKNSFHKFLCHNVKPTLAFYNFIVDD